jgi:hypothetical protein
MSKTAILGCLTLLFVGSAAGQTCDPALFAHTYRPERFLVISKCASFTGIVESIRPEPDGDLHIRLRLDPGQPNPLNAGNIKRQHSCLVVEPICQKTPTQRDSISACKGFQTTVYHENVGQHVRVRGVLALDKPHGWNEIHAAQLEVIP